MSDSEGENDTAYIMDNRKKAHMKASYSSVINCDENQDERIHFVRAFLASSDISNHEEFVKCETILIEMKQALDGETEPIASIFKKHKTENQQRTVKDEFVRGRSSKPQVVDPKVVDLDSSSEDDNWDEIPWRMPRLLSNNSPASFRRLNLKRPKQKPPRDFNLSRPPPPVHQPFLGSPFITQYGPSLPIQPPAAQVIFANGMYYAPCAVPYQMPYPVPIQPYVIPAQVPVPTRPERSPTQHQGAVSSRSQDYESSSSNYRADDRLFRHQDKAFPVQKQQTYAEHRQQLQAEKERNEGKELPFRDPRRSRWGKAQQRESNRSSHSAVDSRDSRTTKAPTNNRPAIRPVTDSRELHKRNLRFSTESFNSKRQKSERTSTVVRENPTVSDIPSTASSSVRPSSSAQKSANTIAAKTNSNRAEPRNILFSATLSLEQGAPEPSQPLEPSQRNEAISSELQASEEPLQDVAAAPSLNADHSVHSVNDPQALQSASDIPQSIDTQALQLNSDSQVSTLIPRDQIKTEKKTQSGVQVCEVGIHISALIKSERETDSEPDMDADTVISVKIERETDSNPDTGANTNDSDSGDIANLNDLEDLNCPNENLEPLLNSNEIKKEVQAADEQEEDSVVQQQQMIRLRNIHELIGPLETIPDPTQLNNIWKPKPCSRSPSPTFNEPRSPIDNDRNWFLPSDEEEIIPYLPPENCS